MATVRFPAFNSCTHPDTRLATCRCSWSTPAREPVLLTVDAVYTEVNWAQDTPGAMSDESLGQRSVARLREVARRSSARVFFGHDRYQCERPQWQPWLG